MRRYNTSALMVSAALAFLAGCERGPQADRPSAGGANTNTPVAEKKVADAAPAGGPATEQTNAPTPGMVRIIGGRFLMGDKAESDAPPHEAIVGTFDLDTHLTTQEQYQKVMGENPSRWKGDKNPVEQVRWSDAVKYCNKRSQLEGLQPCYDLSTWQCNFEANGYRLPTEAEWEYACRAGTTTAYFLGDTPAKLGDYAWYDKNAGGHPRPVGQKRPNPWGLFDMGGNVWQWCNDFYQVDYYRQAPLDNPRGPATGETKVVRGGAWRFSDESCRSGYRYNENPGYADVCFGYDIYGFRCARKVSGGSASSERSRPGDLPADSR